MLLPAFILFFLFLLLSALFSASETAFIAANPYKLDYLEKKGSKRARVVKKLLRRVDHILATVLIGNNFVNAAAASVATSIFISIVPNRNQAVLLATVVTTLLLLILSEITPKTYAAHNPIKISFILVQPVRFFIVIFYPFVKAFTFFSRLIFPSSREEGRGLASTLNEEEIKVLLARGIKGMSTLKKRMIYGVLDIGSRPIREVMIPRPKVSGIEVTSSLQQILEVILSTGFSRFPVYKGRLDNIEGIIQAKEVIPYIIENKEINIYELLRKPFFVPESASLEKVLLQMQETANHLVFVVDEFGNMEGIATLDDIIEEIVGEIQDGYGAKVEEWFCQVEKNAFIINGRASIKDVNQRLPFKLPERKEYTTLAGFFLYQFGKIPQEGELMNYKGHKFIVEKMSKRHISLLRVILKEKKDESRSHQ